LPAPPGRQPPNREEVTITHYPEHQHTIFKNFRMHFIPNEIYHVYNRGNEKRTIFLMTVTIFSL